jgi:hypothetical protein
MPGRRAWLVPCVAVSLAFFNQALIWYSAKQWYEGRALPGLQTAYWALWQLGMLLWFAWQQRRNPYFKSGRWQLLFWAVQGAWAGLGWWCFSRVFAQEPLVMGAAPGWIFGSVLLALWVDEFGSKPVNPGPPLGALKGNPYSDVLKSLGRTKE